MLLDARQPAKALAEYEAALKISPNRFKALGGAAKSAELNIVSMRRGAHLGPDAHILELCVYAAAGGQHFTLVPPVEAGEVHRSRNAEL